MASKKVAFIGCVESSYVALRELISCSQYIEVVAVITKKTSGCNADFKDLSPLVKNSNIPVLYIEDEPEEARQVEWLRIMAVDIVFCVGWSRLLGREMLRLAPDGVVGYHPAELPANRGRHPIVWALALGLDQTASSFFLMDEHADSGPILHQEVIAIAPGEAAFTLYEKLLNVIPRQIRAIAKGLEYGTFKAVQQNHDLANCWRKRGIEDGRIDWRMSAEDIDRLVRALSVPYPGSHFEHSGADVKQWRCAVVENATRNMEPGKVIEVDGRVLTVKCGPNALRLIEHGLGTIPVPGDCL
ncbi:methionyl-tRNA formyltransferase [Sedimenticola sp.]|uniref:methionyl-tRNA formyltransferase n=1 Tax=Sedimenticola sp. TaxID=1940285 RepID=UPI003D0BE186